MLSNDDPLRTRIEADLLTEYFTHVTKGDITQMAPHVTPLVWDRAKAFRFSENWEEGDPRFAKSEKPEISWGFSMLAMESRFRLCVRYGRFSLATPWVTDGIL